MVCHFSMLFLQYGFISKEQLYTAAVTSCLNHFVGTSIVKNCSSVRMQVVTLYFIDVTVQLGLVTLKRNYGGKYFGISS